MSESTTVRKLKECCVSLHSNRIEWKRLTSRGLNVATSIVNNSISVRNDSFSQTPGTHPVAEQAMILENNFAQLFDILNEMERTVQRIGSLCTNVQAISDLLTLQNMHITPVFETLLPHEFCEGFNIVFRSHCEELTVNRRIMELLTQSGESSRSVLLFYLSCWSQEPYSSDPNIITTLERMLFDCNLRS